MVNMWKCMAFPRCMWSQCFILNTCELKDDGHCDHFPGTDASLIGHFFCADFCCFISPCQASAPRTQTPWNVPSAAAEHCGKHTLSSGFSSNVGPTKYCCLPWNPWANFEDPPLMCMTRIEIGSMHIATLMLAFHIGIPSKNLACCIRISDCKVPSCDELHLPGSICSHKHTAWDSGSERRTRSSSCLRAGGPSLHQISDNMSEIPAYFVGSLIIECLKQVHNYIYLSILYHRKGIWLWVLPFRLPSQNCNLLSTCLKFVAADGPCLDHPSMLGQHELTRNSAMLLVLRQWQDAQLVLWKVGPI